MIQAVILAGGKGTRLAERLRGRPKPLVDVCGVPLLQRQIEHLHGQGIKDFVILVNHAADQIERFLEQSRNFGCRITVIDDGEPRGTAGAILDSLEVLEEEFLVVYGDTLLDVDVLRMARAHRQANADGTLFLHPNDHPHDSDLVAIDERGWVTGFHPYPHPPGEYLPNLVNAALYILRRDSLRPWRSLSGVVDFGKDLFGLMLKADLRLKAYKSFEYIKDVGTPKRLDKVERHLREGVVARARISHPQPTVFVDRDGTLNAIKVKGYVHSPDDLELIDGAAEAVRRLNELEYRVCVVTNQPVIARGDIDEASLAHIHAKLETELGGGGAFVDGIYYCPHHPDKGFEGERAELKVACECRKPKPGLLRAAAENMNSDISRSFMIGDSTADIAAGQAFGVRTILVETGEGGRDGAVRVTPDFTARNLAQAVELISVYPRLVERSAMLAGSIRPGALILIGGLARSGKSTLASVLAHELRARGLTVQALSLDRWLCTPDARGPGVLGRFDLVATVEALGPWLRGGALRAYPPFYDRFTRASLSEGPAVELPAEGVLILDGVPALTVPFATERTLHRLYIEADEGERSQRVIADLGRRGHSPEAARATFQDRSRDETPIIAESAGAADVRLTIDDILRASSK